MFNSQSESKPHDWKKELQIEFGNGEIDNETIGGYLGKLENFISAKKDLWERKAYKNGLIYAMDSLGKCEGSTDNAYVGRLAIRLGEELRRIESLNPYLGYVVSGHKALWEREAVEKKVENGLVCGCGISHKLVIQNNIIISDTINP